MDFIRLYLEPVCLPEADDDSDLPRKGKTHLLFCFDLFYLTYAVRVLRIHSIIQSSLKGQCHEIVRVVVDYPDKVFCDTVTLVTLSL